jgi:hypothetical protein
VAIIDWWSFLISDRHEDELETIWTRMLNWASAVVRLAQILETLRRRRAAPPAP